MNSRDPVDDAALYTQVRVGPGIALVNGHSFALLGPNNGALADRLWSASKSGAGVDELLEELSATGLRSLGDFAMAEVEDTGIRIVVRGLAIATVRSGAGTRKVEAAEVKTWVEEIVQDADWFELKLSPDEVDELPFRLSSGVLPADVLRWSRMPVEISGLEDVDLAWADEFEPIEVGSRQLDEPQPPSGLEVDSGASLEVPNRSVEQPEQDSGLTIASADAPPDSQLAQGQASLREGQDGEEEYDYNALFGRTVAKSVQSAAMDVVDDEAVHDEDDRGDIAPVGDEREESIVEQTPGGSLIDLVPPTGAPPAQPIDPNLGDHDGHTMSIAQLRALRNKAGAYPAPASVSPPAMGGPTVQAVLCQSGHPNPPHFATCRVCADGLSAAPVVVARPKMGRLMMSSGQVVELDRPAIIGRKPKAEGRMPNEVPQLIALDVGQGLSRSHAMIQLEQWQVLLEDLDSANGTVVTLPGREPRRLHVGEPVLLEHGTIVDLGGEVTATVDLMS